MCTGPQHEDTKLEEKDLKVHSDLDVPCDGRWSHCYMDAA